jgi:hypothetical protein
VKIPTSKIESRAINLLESIADKHNSIDYRFNQGDKEMSWDGFIWLYEMGTPEFSKSNFKYRAPVQIKGHYSPDDDIPSNNTANFPVDLLDLKAYSTEKGVVYFHIFVGPERGEIFYRALYPSVIASILDHAAEKGNEKSVTIQFRRLPQKPDILYEVIEQFCTEAFRQGSTGNPLVQDRIKIQDFDKISLVSMHCVGDWHGENLLQRLASGDVCLYGKIGDEKYPRPLEWIGNTQFYISQEITNQLSIDGEVFYEKYKLERDSMGNVVIIPSSNLQLRLSEDKIFFKPVSTAREIYEDLLFIKKLAAKQALCIGDKVISFEGMSLPSDFQEVLEFFTDLYIALLAIGYEPEHKFFQFEDKDYCQLRELVKIKRGESKTPLQNGFYKHIWKFDEKNIPLLITKEGDNIELYNAVYTDKFALYSSVLEQTDASYRLPLFMQLEDEILSNLYEYRYDSFRKQIDDSEICAKSEPSLINCVLLLINVYDLNQDINFLDLADYLLEKLIFINNGPRNLINAMQIKKRRGTFTEDDQILLREIISEDVVTNFGIYVLLDDYNSAKACIEKFDHKSKESVKQWPIYHLYQDLEKRKGAVPNKEHNYGN